MSDDKKIDAKDAGAAVVNLIEKDIKPRDIMTRKAFENAITVVITLGGSTNAVLHLLAMAHAADVELSLDDFTEIGKRVPVLCDLKPSGKYNMSHFVRIGGLRPASQNSFGRGTSPWRLYDRNWQDTCGKCGRCRTLCPLPQRTGSGASIQ